MSTRQQKLSDIETKMNRWLARGMRATNALHKLAKQKQRLLKATAERPRGHAVLADLGGTLAIAARESAEDAGLIPVKDDDLTIPPELNRADPLIAERMTAARKKAEAEARKAMPLSGKAALDYIKTPRKRKA